MRRSIIAAIASFTILACAPSAQASPLIRGGNLAAAAAQSNVEQVHYYRHGYRHYGYRHWGWRHRHHGYWGWRHRHYHRHWY